MNPLKNIEVLDSEFCPCSSGVKHRDCCKNKKVTLPQASKKPPEGQIMDMMRKSMKRCFKHPDKAHCKGKIKEAHALQNNKIISMLAGREHYVYMMNAKKRLLLMPLEKENQLLLFK